MRLLAIGFDHVDSKQFPQAYSLGPFVQFVAKNLNLRALRALRGSLPQIA
ncbi:hypothetical protein JOD20_001784 [Herpetosiphon giganteus]|nr:hypothetical protein [Herpetosiphon giganteus]